MADDLDIPFPFDGLDENWSNVDQPAGSSRELVNVRGMDPKTGRMRGAQRSGLTRYVSPDAQVSGDNPVKALASAVYGVKNVKYEAKTDANINVEKSATLGLNEGAYACVTDRQGNVWAIAGARRLVKYNSEMELLQEVTLPLASGTASVFALDIDEFDNVYVAVSVEFIVVGSSVIFQNQDKAAIWCFRPIAGEKVEQLWEILPNAFVPSVRVHQGKLYTVQNRRDQNRSDIVVYGAIDSTAPVEVLRVDGMHPFPGSCLAVGKDGSIFAGATTFAQRGTNPKEPASGPITIGWTPDDWQDKDVGLWRWHSARFVLGKELENGGLETDDHIPYWADLSGKERHLYPDFQNGHKAPTFRKEGWAGLPSIRFNGIDEVLASLESLGTDPETAQSNKTLLPADENSAFCIFAVVRLAEEDETTLPGVLLAQHNHGPAIGQKFTHGIWINRTPGLALPGTVATGLLSVYDNDEGTATRGQGGGAAGQPFQANFTQKTDQASNHDSRVVLITYLNDGGLQPSASGAAAQTATRSVLRLNGNPIDRWTSQANKCKGGTRGYVGWGEHVAIGGGVIPTVKDKYFRGEFLELIVLRNKATTGEPKILSHPFYGQNPGVDDAANGATAQTDMEKFEGYLAHAWGIAKNFPQADVTGGASVAPAPPAGAKHEYLHSYATLAPLGTGQADVNVLNNLFANLVKYDPAGAFKWAVTAEDGVGSGVAIASDGSVFSMGPADKPAGDNNVLRKIKDNETSAATSGAGTWATETALQPGAGPSRIVVDEFDNAYFPFDDLNVAHKASVAIYALDGTKLAQFEDAAASAGAACYGVALPPAAPAYKDGEDFTSPSTYERAEHCFIANNFQTYAPTTSIPGLRKLSLVTVSSLGGTNRAFVHLAVANGDIKKFTTAGYTVPSGGTAALDPAAQFVSAVSYFGRVYFTDGKVYRLYDPAEDEVVEWFSKSAGEIPKRGKLLFVYRGRLGVARLADDPQNYAMLAVGDAENADFFPPEISPTQAVAGNLARVGTAPDIINTVAAWSDDLVLFGCDHSMWMLRGDPMAGGEFDQVSMETGMAFGPSWALDPDGAMYFMGQQSGLWRITPGSGPVLISENRIERRLVDIDLSLYYFHLVWNEPDKGLHIFVVPFDEHTGSVEHYFWSKKTARMGPIGAFFPDRFKSDLHQPTAAIVLDGDEPEDRALVLGCGDGRLRKWDRSAVNDDDEPIVSDVLIGPIAGREMNRELKLRRVQAVLASDQGGATAEVYTNDTPDSIGAVKSILELGPGRNPSLPISNGRGSYVFVRLRNALPGQGWAFEHMSCRYEIGGRRRVRAS